MKVVIIGGHLGPALSVIEALQKKDTEILFFGRKHVLEGDDALSLEQKTITERGIKFFEVVTGRLQRKFTGRTVFSLFKIPYGFIQAFSILKKEKPDIVVGFGGYLSLPVALAAFFLNIPVVIHEQTLEAGMSNKIISLFAKKVCISWESSGKYFPKEKTVLTGNPMRKFSILLSRINFQFSIPKEKLPVLYVTGGSSGSHFINTLIEECLLKLLEKFVVIHQTGDAREFGDFDRLCKLQSTLPLNLRDRYMPIKFVDPSDVGGILQKADLVVGRSGINTVTELLFFKKPALLIPLPYSQGGEQMKNALFLKNKGIAEIFKQNEDKDFLKIITEMSANIDIYKKNVKGLENLINKSAADKIAEVILLCLKKQEEAKNRE